MGVKFPESVRWVGCRVDQWMDTSIYIRCEMPKREVAKLVPGKTLKWQSSGSQIHNSAASERWFTPDAITHYQYAEVRHHPVDNGFLSILYDDSVSGDAMTTVYLFWFDT